MCALPCWGCGCVSGLAGAALTIDTPTLQRVAGMVPTAGADARRVSRPGDAGHPPLRWRVPLPSRARVLRAGNGRLLVLLIVAARRCKPLAFYFGPYTARPIGTGTRWPGAMPRKLDPQRDMVYQMDVPGALLVLGPALFLADRVQGRSGATPATNCR